MHYTLEAREDDCLQNHTVHVSIRVCWPFTKGGCAHGIRGEGELCSTYSLDKCFAAYRLQGDRGREAQRGAAAGSYCAAGLKTH